MLVQFSMKNVLSFKDEAVLDMTAISAYKEHKENLINISDKCKDKVVSVVTIYGANASGKSNLYAGMKGFQRIISESLNNVDDDDKPAIDKYYNPYSFEDKHDNSEYQIIEIINGVEYKYGFEYNDKRVVTEWLYLKKLSTNRTSIILERDGGTINFGATVRRECDMFKEQIPTETLVLSFLNKLKVKTKVFEDVYSAIMDILVVPSNFCEDSGILKMMLPEIIDNHKDELLRFLGAIDTGIKDINYVEREGKIEFNTFHYGKNGKKYSLNLGLESEGTIKSVILFIYARVAILYEKSIFVDELNTKLHPLLLKFIIDLFYNKKSKAQLIYTTHDTTLMDRHFFRRDQIWFVQKDEFGCSQLFALSDFKVRSDASFEKDYLAGVYGGIPTLEEFDLKEVE